MARTGPPPESDRHNFRGSKPHPGRIRVQSKVEPRSDVWPVPWNRKIVTVSRTPIASDG